MIMDGSGISNMFEILVKLRFCVNRRGHWRNKSRRWSKESSGCEVLGGDWRSLELLTAIGLLAEVRTTVPILVPTGRQTHFHLSRNKGRRRWQPGTATLSNFNTALYLDLICHFLGSYETKDIISGSLSSGRECKWANIGGSYLRRMGRWLSVPR